jgi:hypothetical protein
VLATALTAGCSVLGHLVPTALRPAQYVVNRGGHYYVGHRCASALTEVGVFPADPYTPVARVDYSQAAWRAVSDAPVVREFEVYGAGQAGVAVRRDDGTRPTATPVIIYFRDDEDWEYGTTVLVLEDIPDGYVWRNSGGQTLTWEDYWGLDDEYYGC